MLDHHGGEVAAELRDGVPAAAEIQDEVASLGPVARTEPDELADAARRRLRRFFRREIYRTPVVIPLVIEV